MLLSVDFSNLHTILETLYDDMLPLCEDMMDVGKGIAGHGGDSAKDFFWPNDVFDIHCDKKNHRMGTWAGWWLQ